MLKPLSQRDHTLLWERSVMGITNLLEANMEAGLVHCLRLSYHDDARIRAIFLNIFTKIMNAGTHFKIGSGTSKASHHNSKLCEASDRCLGLFPFIPLTGLAVQMLKTPDVRRSICSGYGLTTNVIFLAPTCADDY
jgi:hypothetical protein